MSWRARSAAVLLLIVWGGEARPQTRPAKVEREARFAPDLKELVKRGQSAYARRAFDEAVEDFSEALKRAPGDVGLREKLERALDRRARAREAIAARPPPTPVGMSDGPRDSGLVAMFKDLRWQARLKREAFEARAEAEAALPNPDEKKLARLRDEAAGKKAEEDRLTAAIADEQKKEAASKAEQEKAFEGFPGIGLGAPRRP